jgi:Fe-Mn family superoxide dismutase
MTLKLPKLQYAEDALEPHISRDTIKYHYGKHTKKYFDTANELIKGTVYQNKPLEDLINKDTMSRMGSKLFNNVCQAYNHSFYWDCLTPEKSSGKPSEELHSTIQDEFGSFELFQDQFLEKSGSFFGSGWTWFIYNNGKLQIKTMPNAGCPLTTPNQIPLLVCDLWEHSYLYDPNYVADRKGYVAGFWNVINWNFVNNNFEAVAGKKDKQ